MLDGLVHNAGAMFSERREVDGIETTVLLHVVAPFLLTHHLLEPLERSDHPGRVVWLSSGGMYTERLDVDLREPRRGADTAAWLIAAPEGARHPGSLWLDRRRRSASDLPGTATTPDQAMALWSEVTALAGVGGDAFSVA